MGAANYARHGWSGALLVRESVVQRTASLGDGAGEASDDVAFGASQPELRRREKLGTVWTEHNLLALLQEQGLINQATKRKRYPLSLAGVFNARRSGGDCAAAPRRAP